MGVRRLCALALFAAIICMSIPESKSQVWSGNIVSYRRWRYSTCWRCVCRYWWGCSLWRPFICIQYYWDSRCRTGWRHNGNRNCNIPICLPRCANGGTCVNPNTCNCPPGTSGEFCQQLLCAYERPCYPGNCYNNDKCNCTEGFDKESPGEYGCLELEDSEQPSIGRSTAIIEYVRRTDQAELYYFLLDGTNETLADPVWSNQKRFNLLSFEFEAKYPQPEEFPERPAYVHEVKLGIVRGKVDVVAEFYNGTIKQTYSHECAGVSQVAPEEDVFNCTITDTDYITLAEHAEKVTFTYTAYSGGFRRMLNSGSFGPYEYFRQQSASKEVSFRFDFIAPRHCSQNNSYSTCTNESTPLTVIEEFTKNPIRVRWDGWADESFGAGMWLYYFEVHKLINKNPRLGTLTEEDPINPYKSFNVTADTSNTEITVSVPGMYSILMEARDIANNSRWTRQLVLFDNYSTIVLNTESNMFFVSSARAQSNYTWQTASAGSNTTFVVEWANHFSNPFHDNNLLLNEVEPFPIQFAEVEAEGDGVLSTTKFVADFLDDHRGLRTLEAISNIRGIVKFEYTIVTTNDASEPTQGWRNVPLLAEFVTFIEMLENGAAVRVWVRAHDIMGNTKADSTVVRIDSTPPRLQNVNDTEFRLNQINRTFTHTSLIEFEAQDPESGVYNISISIEINVPDKPTETFRTQVPANIDMTKDPVTDPACIASRDPNICFIKEQRVELDNCWFMIEDRQKLPNASATININVFNQAHLNSSLSYRVENLTKLSGISVYSGPTNFRFENVLDQGFRLAWDLPDRDSCYGRADVVILVYEVTATGQTTLILDRIASSTALFFDFGGLSPQSSYRLNVGSRLPGGGSSGLGIFEAQTAAPTETSEGVSMGIIIGVVAGLLVIIVLVVVVMIFLVRRGIIHPVERARSIKRRATTRIRKTIYGEEALHRHGNRSRAAYDNRQSEIYIYGGDDFDGPQSYHIDRDDITFETLIKSGHFANIYKAVLNRGHKSTETIVAKTLKENFTPEDEQLMKAKINFTGTVVGDHHNVLKFMGAVVDDAAMGPFILYEYCEHGPLKDYLKSQKGNVTIELQDNLFRFGLDIARGLEYLAAKDIVHRRLAARNILLTFLNEIKIAGFGPQPLNGGEEDVEQGKKERIPIKWMAPECMKSTTDATEKSDVWSYAVVLWEIFSLGDDPYMNVRGRDLPGKIKKGERLLKPEQCDDTWYAVMSNCWNYTASKRPSFSEIRSELDSLFTQAPGDEDYYYYKR